MEYPSNKFNQPSSPEPQKEEKKITKVVDGTIKKRGKIGRLRDAFLPEDVASVRSYIFSDILIPYIKKGADDIFHTFLWGVGSSKSSSSRGMQPSYRDYYDKKTPSTTSRLSTAFTFDYIEVANIGDANMILDMAGEIIAKYGVLSVNDYYDLAGQHGTYQDSKYGWTDIRTAKVERTREGTYLVVMPRPLPLN